MKKSNVQLIPSHHKIHLQLEEMESLVQGTNDSSIVSKHSMVYRGYFEDEMIRYFAPKDTRRSPLIHLGYFTRALVMDHAIRNFIECFSEKNPQILSLGAGFDSTYFRLHSTFPEVVYYEVDLHDVVRNKINVIMKSARLSSLIIDIDDSKSDRTSLKSKKYTIFVQDLSDLEGLQDKLVQFGLDFKRPTLVFSECAITYMEEEKSTKLIEWVVTNMASPTFINYEQVCPDDGFGQVMVAHFNKIQSPLKSISKYKTFEDQRKRYTDAGWDHCRVFSVMDLFHSILSGNERVRIFKIEPFDEWEEFHLKCCHYSLAVASQDEAILSRYSVSKYGTDRRNKTIDVKPLDNIRLERYGHTCVQISDGSVLVIGGFGSQGGHRHGRSKEIICIGPNPKTLSLLDDNRSINWDSMYHSCTLIRKDEFIIFGGRTSPAKVVNVDPVYVKVAISEQTLEMSAEVLPVEGTRPSPRWRHTAVHYDESLLIYGGRNKELEVFGDLWALEVNKSEHWKWNQKVFPDDRGPCNRFSHAMTSANGIIYMSGGLDDKFTPLNDVWELKFDEGSALWTQVVPLTQAPHIYSHTLHWYRGKLIFVGGINTSSTDLPSLSVLDLTTLQYQHYEFKITLVNFPVMLHNHSSILNEDKSEVCSYGGGGNCFSFGTHFNQNPLKILLADL